FLGRKHCNTGHDDDLFFLHNYMDLILNQARVDRQNVFARQDGVNLARPDRQIVFVRQDEVNGARADRQNVFARQDRVI
ncbi:hypothetical protein WMO40_21535, partial [Bacillaceae bacterium CLA-AA-H227]